MDNKTLHQAEKTIADIACILELTGHSSMGHTYIIKSTHIITGEQIYIEVTVRTATIMKAITEVEEDVNLAEFENARNKIKAYRAMGMYLPEFSMFETRMARMELLAEEE